MIYIFIKLLRPKQWIKNGFVLLPLIFSRSYYDMNAFSDAVLASLLFCIASSAVYILNDLIDVSSDRMHIKKSKSRPIASGQISEKAALFFLIFIHLFLFVFVFFANLDNRFVSIIYLYVFLNLGYSFGLKKVPVIDIFIVASGFVLRVLSGGYAINVVISSWMLITTLMLALFLASIKRRQELLTEGSSSRSVLNSYNIDLVTRYSEISATAALFFYSMFVMSAKPNLMLTIPLVVFGIFRYWYIVDIENGGESPTDTLLSDWYLIGVVFCWLFVSVVIGY